MSSSRLVEVLELIQPFFYGVLTLVALIQWRRHPGPPSAWLLAAFTALFAVIAASRLLPTTSDEPIVEWTRKAMIGVLVLFPYCLYRFMSSFVPPKRWVRIAAIVLTAGVALAALVLPTFPEEGEARPAWFRVFVMALLVQWVFLTGLVVVRLWRAGRNQPAVARRRLRTLSLGAAGLALALVVAGEFSEGSASAIIVPLLGLAAAPLMLVGFAPPYSLRTWWRRKEDAALRRADLSLMGATSTDEVAQTLLPHARALLGAETAILETAEGETIAVDGPVQRDADLDPASSSDPPPAATNGSAVSIAMQSHRLTILASPFTPFFGSEEIGRLESLAALADLALARNALLGNQRHLAAIVESSRDAIITKTLDGIITSWNLGAERIYGYSAEEVVGKPVTILVPPDVENDVPKILQRLRAGDDVIHYETQRQTKTGRVIDVALTVSPVHDASGAIAGASTIARDVTDRKQVERQLRTSREQLANAQRTANIGSWTWDVVQDRRTWSDEFYRIFGLTPGEREPTMEQILELIHPDDAALFREATARALESHEPFTLEYRIRRPDGVERTVEARGTVSAENGRALSMTGTVQDVTERRRIERERELARQEAERANRAKNDFLSRMSHELRTPLNAVLGFAQLLEMDSLTPEQKESTNEILKAGAHLLDLINEVLDIARIEAGKLRLSVEPVEVVQVLEECMSLLTPLAAKERIRLNLVNNGGSEAHVMADRQRLKQVFLNVISNGIKYNRQEGSVLISVRPSDQGGAAVIEVRDDGHGIPPERMEKLFSPFERLGAESSRVEGVGLGLAISKSLIDAMGGSISAHSELEKGTTFWLELPCSDEANIPTRVDTSAGEGEPEGPETRHSRRILYIEDNLSNVKLLERLAERRSDTELISAMQGGLGLTLARDHRPDVVLLDLDLPDMTGEEVLLRLQAEPRTADIPVIVVSADATTGQIERLLEAGARAYLTKPMDVGRFFEVLDEIFRGETGSPNPAGNGQPPSSASAEGDREDVIP